jgi:hypothetical protein
MEGVLAIITIFGILPISITGMTMYYNLKKAQLKQGQTLSLPEIEAVKKLAAENQELRKRMENVELIVHEATLLSTEEKKKIG